MFGTKLGKLKRGDPFLVSLCGTITKDRLLVLGTARGGHGQLALTSLSWMETCSPNTVGRKGCDVHWCSSVPMAPAEILGIRTFILCVPGSLRFERAHDSRIDIFVCHNFCFHKKDLAFSFVVYLAT